MMDLYIIRCVRLAVVCLSCTNFQPNSFMYTMHLGIIDFYHFGPLFSGLDLGWSSQGQHRAKHVDFHFLAHFLNGWDKI